MNENKKRLFHLIFSCVIGALVIALGVLFIVSCIGIYRSGERPFTRASVGDALAKIAIPSIITVVAIIGGAIVELILPENRKKSNRPTSKMLLSNLKRRVDTASLTEDELAAARCEQKKRLIMHIGGLVILIISVVYPLIYVFTPERFGDATTANADIGAGMIAICIFLIPAVIYSVIVSFIMDKSRAREADVLKAAIVRLRGESAIPKNATEAECEGFFKRNSRLLINCLRGGVVILGLVFVILGISNGGMADVLGKAVRICTECIGLG